MIGYLRGQIKSVDGNEIIVEAGQSGVGYRVLMANFEGSLVEGEEIALQIYTQVREDAIELFGFRTRDERLLFTLLISVKGVGSKLAIAVLSTMTPAELQTAILSGNVSALKNVPGVGPTVAKRLVMELEGKVRTCHFADRLPEFSPVSASAHGDTRSALKNFGFADADIDRVLQKLDESGEKLDVQGEIRWALKAMSSGQ